MLLKVFALMDVKAGFMNVPFFFPSTGQAVRAVTDLVADASSIISRHPADFALYEIGTWDDSTGRFDQSAGLLHLGTGVSFAPGPRSVDPDLFGAPGPSEPAQPSPRSANGGAS